jgi:hypothetical protein
LESVAGSGQHHFPFRDVDQHHQEDDAEMSKPRIFIKISGGRVQGTVADIPCDIEILDYDTEGVEDDELYAVPEKNGEIDDCIVYSEQPLVDPAYCDEIETALTDDEKGSSIDRRRARKAEQDAGEVIRDLGDDL